MSIFKMPVLDTAAYLDTEQGKKSLQLAAQKEFEEALAGATRWTIVASATGGDMSVHTELNSDQLNANSNGRPTGAIPKYEVELESDNEDDWNAGFEERNVPLKVARVTNVRLNLAPGEGKNLLKALNKRDPNPNSNALSVQFYVYAKPLGNLSMQGVNNTLVLDVIHLDYNSFCIPTGQVPTASEAAAAWEAIATDRAERRSAGIALAKERRTPKAGGQTTMSSDVAAEPIQDAAAILADQEAAL